MTTPIHFVVKHGHRYPLVAFLETWAPQLRPTIRFLRYGDLVGRRRFEAGVYVFADLERLEPPELRLSSALADELDAHPGTVRVLNHPGRALRRRRLLETLADRGINRHRVYPATRLDQVERFPVYLRQEGRHRVEDGRLIFDENELRRRAAESILKGHRPDRTLVVEFVDTRDDWGLYRKYGAFVIGDRIIARHLLFSDRWIVKVAGPNLVEWFASEREYVDTNPHRDELAAIARLANIEYGRIDYAVHGDGRLEIWEVNTNPVITTQGDETSPRATVHHRVLPHIADAFAALTEGLGEDEVIVNVRADIIEEARRHRDREPAAVRAKVWVRRHPALTRVQQALARHVARAAGPAVLALGRGVASRATTRS